MANGKIKGGNFERLICRTLSEWWSEGLLGACLTDIYWRTAGSGSRATTRKKTSQRTKGQHGDICATDPLGQPLIDLLTIETKSGYSSHSFADLIDKPAGAKKQLYETWFDKARRDSEASGAFGWLLISKRNRRETLVFMDESVAQKLDLIDCSPHHPAGAIEIDKWVVFFMTFDNFLQLAEPEQIVKLAHKHMKEK